MEIEIDTHVSFLPNSKFGGSTADCSDETLVSCKHVQLHSTLLSFAASYLAEFV